MPPGKKVSVKIKIMQRTSDGMGGFTNTYSDVATFKAVLTPLKGKEEFQTYNKETVFADYILYAKNISSSFDEFHVVEHDARNFKIAFIKKPFMSNKFFILYLEEVK